MDLNMLLKICANVLKEIILAIYLLIINWFFEAGAAGAIVVVAFRNGS
jgi:hypothetical protein